MNKPKDLLITAKDLFDIKGLAKDVYKNIPTNLHISNKKLDEDDFVHYSLANALILWLNKNKALNTNVSFDITDHSGDFEGEE